MNLAIKPKKYALLLLGIILSFAIFFVVFMSFNGIAVKRHEKIVLDYMQTVGQVLGKNVHTIKIIEIFSRKIPPSENQRNYEIFGEIITEDNETLKAVASAVTNSKAQTSIIWKTKDFFSYVPENYSFLLETTSFKAMKNNQAVMSEPFSKHDFSGNMMLFVYPFSETSKKDRFIVGVFDIDGLLRAVLNRHDTPAGLDITIKDIATDKAPIILGFHKSRIKNSSRILPNFSQNTFTAKLEIGSRNWQFEFKPVSSLVSPIEFIISLFSALSAALVYFLLIKYLHILQIQRLQNARLASLGETSAGLAHELNQPLNIINLKAENLILEKQKNHFIEDTTLEKNLKIIAEQAMRMSKIIDHVRVFARKDGGDDVVFSARDAILNALNMFNQVRREIRVISSVSGNDYYTKGQQIKLEQVIINILLNARDAINEKFPENTEKGQITLNLSLAENQTTIILEITNNGANIDRRHLKRLFKRFFTTKKSGNGLGLGLALCYDIIKSMNGSIAAAKLSEGTSFIIKLPHYMNNSKFENIPRDEPIEPETPHILVVDDEIDALSAMSECLENEGFRVSTAENLSSAISCFENDPCDILITDIKIGLENGFDLVQELKLYNDDLPIILVSGHLDFHEIDKTCKELYANDAVVMIKPISRQELITKVKNVWEKQYKSSNS